MFKRMQRTDLLWILWLALDLVVNMLNSECVILPKPKQPAYFFTRSIESEVSPWSMNISITLQR